MIQTNGYKEKITVLKIYDDTEAENICARMDNEIAALETHIEELTAYGELPDIVLSMQARQDSAMRIKANIQRINNKMHEIDSDKALLLAKETEKLKAFAQKLRDINSILENVMNPKAYIFNGEVGGTDILTEFKTALSKYEEGSLVIQEFPDEVITYMDTLREQFGFDERTVEIIGQIYMNTQAEYRDKTQAERDWYFARALSQMGGYTNYEFIGLEIGVWANGAGLVYGYKEEDETGYFCERLNITEKDYRYVRQMIRLQHLMVSDPDNYSYKNVSKLNESTENKPRFQTFKESMEKGIGKKLTDGEYTDLYEEAYPRMGINRGDFSHMMYTISAHLTDDAGKVVAEKGPILLPSELEWKDTEERKDIAGWLGDAVYASKNSATKQIETSFGNDDFLADLDADNISQRVAGGGNLLTGTNQYYEDISITEGDKGRITEFLKNNPYKKVEEKIFQKIFAFDTNEDGKKTAEDIKNNIKYKETYEFLRRLQEYEGKE